MPTGRNRLRRGGRRQALRAHHGRRCPSGRHETWRASRATASTTCGPNITSSLWSAPSINSRSARFPAASECRRTVSVLERLNLPANFGYALLILGLALVLAPYLRGRCGGDSVSITDAAAEGISMRGEDRDTGALFSYVDLESRFARTIRCGRSARS